MADLRFKSSSHQQHILSDPDQGGNPIVYVTIKGLLKRSAPF